MVSTALSNGSFSTDWGRPNLDSPSRGYNSDC